MDRQLLTTSLLAFVLLVTGAGLTARADPEERRPQDKDFEGVWELVSSVKDGQKLPKPRGGKKIVVTHEGGAYTYQIGDDLVATGMYKVDATKTPRVLDLMPAVGPNKGKTVLGIYAVKGDELQACFSEPGKGRPTEFVCKEGSGLLLNTWKRVKP